MKSLSLESFASFKRTIYVTGSSKSPAVTQSCFSYTEQGKTVRIPLEKLRRVVLLGSPALDSPALYILMKKGIPVDWLDRYGRPMGVTVPMRIERPVRFVEQTAFRDSEAAFELARTIILAKIENCERVLRRRGRQSEHWAKSRACVARASTPDALRGAEGAAAREYFAQWAELLPGFPWKGRKSHPAPDPINSLLSLGYSLLYNRLSAALVCGGLDPRKGFFHMVRGTHCALASDLMEDLRHAVDAVVLGMVARKTVLPEHFAQKDGTARLTDGETFGRVLTAFEDMFAMERSMHVPESAKAVRISINDRLDDMVELFSAQLTKGSGYYPFRSSACAPS